MVNEGNTMVMIPLQVWEDVTQDIQELKKLLSEKTAEEINGQWLDSTSARKMLGVSPKTWQTYRDKRIIPFSQVGRKIYVKRSDLLTFMEEHYICAK